MTNTYAINTTRGKEFEVERELRLMGLHPWVPCRIVSKIIRQKSKPVLFDLPYIPKLMFCVFPAVYFRDVVQLKHVIGNPVEMAEKDLRGSPAYTVKGTNVDVPARPGLIEFRRIVEAQADHILRTAEANDWICPYEPGEALRVLEGAFRDLPAEFAGIIKDAQGNVFVEAEIDVFGRKTPARFQPQSLGIAS